LTLNRPWSNISTTHRLIMLDICAKLFVKPTRGSKGKEWTRNKVIQCLILDCDLDLEPTLDKHRHSTLSHYTWHLCKVIFKSHQGFKRYRADTKAWRTDGRTDGQTDWLTTELKTICLPISWGRHNTAVSVMSWALFSQFRVFHAQYVNIRFCSHLFTIAPFLVPTKCVISIAFYLTSILLKKSLRMTRICRTWTRPRYKQVCHKEVGKKQITFLNIVKI